MAICSNCYSAIQEEDLVLSCVDKAPMHKECANKCPSCGGYLTDMQFARNKCKCVTQIHSSLEVVRRSHIELYKQCPYAFYLECIKEVQQENNAYALHGIILHEIFDKYSYEDEISKDVLTSEFMQRFTSEVPKTHYSFEDKPELYDQLIERGLNAVDSFISFHSNTGKPFVTEENITFSLRDDLPKVSITMDRVDQDEDGELHMLDYKCGKTFTGSKLSEDLQVPLYCLALEKQYGKLPKSFTFLFVSQGAERKYTLQENRTYVCTVRKKDYTIQVDERADFVMGILNAIKEEQFSQKSNNAWHCNNMCYYNKKGICEGGNTGWHL